MLCHWALQDIYYIRTLGDVAVLLNTEKQTQGDCQNEETKKHGSNERTDQNSRERTKQYGDKQSNRYRVQNTGYKETGPMIVDYQNSTTVTVTKDSQGT